MQKRFLAAAAVVVVLIAAVLLSGQSFTGRAAASGQEEISAAYLPIASDLDFFVAMDKGFFAEEGLTVNAVPFTKSNDAVSALAAGRVDATAVVASEVAFSAEARSPGGARIVQASVLSNDSVIHKVVVMPSSQIRGLDGLEGKRIGVMPGTNMRTLSRLALSKQINASGIEFVELASELQLGALSSGRVDALITVEPVGTLATEKLGARVVDTNLIAKNLFAPMYNAVDLVSQGLVEQRPAAAAKYARGLARAADFIRENPAEARASLVKWLSIEPSIAAKVGIYQYASADQIDGGRLQELAGVLSENNVIGRGINASAMVWRPL